MWPTFRLESSRQLAAIFVVLTVVPSTMLVILGVLLFQQDRAAAERQLSERRDQAADLVVAELDRNLADVARSLTAPDARRLVTTPDAALVEFSAEGVSIYPSGRVSYVPAPPRLPEAPSPVFERAEGLEMRGELPGAAAAFRELARSPDDAIRAGALFRLGRVLRRLGQIDSAIAAYRDAARVDAVAIAGTPAGLLARWAVCDLLAASERRSDLKTEAGALATDLEQGRWPVTRSVYEANRMDALRWAGLAPEGVTAAPAVEFAVAIEHLWARWRDGSLTSRTPTRAIEFVQDHDIVLLWSRDGDRLTALAAGRGHVTTEWLPRIQQLLDRQQLTATLREPTAKSLGTAEARRVASETGLPWTITVASNDGDAELARIAGRRNLWLTALALLALVVVAGGATIARTVARDLRVARLQSEFVAAVSHEFRTPLTTMRQLTESLVDERLPSETRRDTYYRALARQTDRLQRLVESLLDFGRMETGNAGYRMAPLNLGELVATVIADFRAQVPAGRCMVSRETDAPVFVVGDAEALTTALWNLLDNAVKYSPDSSDVTVRIRRAGGRAAVDVIDRGLGIARDEHAAVFGRFVRGSAAVASRIRGTGVGLAIVRHIVTAHHGDVTVDSEPGRGSTFTISLPVDDSALKASPGALRPAHQEET